MTRASGIFLILFALTAAPALAHDPLEITVTAYLRTNRIELRVVMMRQTIMRVADHQGVNLLDFSIPSERDEAMPMLRSLADGLFSVTRGTNPLRAAQSSVIIGADDHVGFNLVYPVTNSPVTLDAKLLSHLPSVDPYAVNVTVLDMENDQVVTQTLLNAKDAVMKLPPPRPAVPKPETIIP